MDVPAKELWRNAELCSHAGDPGAGDVSADKEQLSNSFGWKRCVDKFLEFRVRVL
jgi:hypothetical protein